MRRCFLLIGVSAVALPLGDAWAQQPATGATPAGSLEEIIVTAQRRSENLQEVPVTVTAVSNDQLETAGVTNVMSLSNLVPSLSVIDPTGYTMAFIRGVGSSTLGAGTFASVATYIDGVYIARTTNALFEFDDVNNIQVLAGPQGALYGRNATAGAIVITTERPAPGAELDGSVSATFGNYNNQSFSGRFSTGLGDQFAIAMSAASHQRDGFVNNLNPAALSHTDDMDDRDAYSGSVTLVWEPTDRMSFALRGSYAESNDRTGGGYEAVAEAAGIPDTRLAYGATVAQLFTPTFGPALAQQIGSEVAANLVFSSKFLASYDNQRDGFANGLLHGEHKGGSALYIENKMVSLNADFQFDSFTLRSVTGYTDSDYHGSVGVSLEAPGSATSATLGAILGAGGPVPINAEGGLGFSSINPSEVFSQGLQFLSSDDSKLKWIGGLDYSKEDGKAILTGDFFGTSLYSANDEWSVESSAAYGQATIPFGSNWSGTLGARYTSETYDITDLFDPTDPNSLPGVLPLDGRHKSKDSNKTTYTARLERQGDGWLAYGGYATGFKSATLNVNSPRQGEAEPEEVESLEAGFKRDFADRYRLNASAYFAKYKGIQLNVINQLTGANYLTNGPDSEVKGLDLQAEARVTDDLKLIFGATVLDAKFTANKPPQQTENGVLAGLDIKGNKLPGAADLAASLIADWVIPLANGGKFGVVPTVVYNSGKFYEHLNLVGSGGIDDDAYTVVNVNVSYTSPNDHWEASLWGNNVFDEEYYRTGITAFGSLGRDAIAGNPATYGVTLKVSF